MKNSQGVLYQRFRPESLDEVWGQDHIKGILGVGIQENSLAHAYLFSGSRGVGKTSVARILASGLNVSGSDLIEIDAASNRGIDDVRELRDSVGFQPAQSKHKVYILDEVHMLTKEAFNALLKVLEEPPDYVIFVLCTTEVHRLPETVVSRCQHLRFMAPTLTELQEYIIDIIGRDGKTAPEGVVVDIAKRSRGSFRDALVLIEQYFARLKSSGNSLEGNAGGLGWDEGGEASKVLEMIEQKEPEGLLELIKSYYEGGGTPEVLLDGLIDQVTWDLLGREDPIARQSFVDEDGLVDLLEGLTLIESRLAGSASRGAIVLAGLLGLVRENKGRGGEAVGRLLKKGEPRQVVSRRLGEDANPISGNVSQTVEKVNACNDFSKTDSVEEKNRWEVVMNNLKQSKSSVEALLKAAEPVFNNERAELELVFTYEFHMQKVQETANWGLVRTEIESVYGKGVSVSCVLSKKRKTVKRVNDELPIGVAENRPDYGQVPVIAINSDQDIMSEAQKLLGGQLVE